MDFFLCVIDEDTCFQGTPRGCGRGLSQTAPDPTVPFPFDEEEPIEDDSLVLDLLSESNRDDSPASKLFRLCILVAIVRLMTHG